MVGKQHMKGCKSQTGRAMDQTDGMPHPRQFNLQAKTSLCVLTQYKELYQNPAPDNLNQAQHEEGHTRHASSWWFHLL